MKTRRWQHIWVEDMPDTMVRGEIYISPKHRLTEHLCACGCGAEVSLPLDPSEWSLKYDGKTISLDPSIGNERIPCKSHYMILRNRTTWCRRISTMEATKKREKDRAKKLDQVAKTRRQRFWWQRLSATIRRHIESD